MHTFYNFVSGPLAWIAFLLFFGGSIYRIVRMLMLVAEKERFYFHLYELALQPALHPSLDHPLCHGELAAPAGAYGGYLCLSTSA
jgi:hypothetical protein